MGPNGPCAGRAGCFGQKSGRKWLFHVVRFGTLWHHGVASRAAREDELEPSVGLPCVCLPVDTCLRGSSDRRFDPHSGPMWTHSGLASECQLVELSARRIVELSHCPPNHQEDAAVAPKFCQVAGVCEVAGVTERTGRTFVSTLYQSGIYSHATRIGPAGFQA